MKGISGAIHCSLLVISVLFVYWSAGSYGYIDFDDPLYIANNSYVHGGLDMKSLRWAWSFEDKEKTYWHPVTWMSFMLDSQLFGTMPEVFHRSNIFFHTTNSLLLFFCLWRMTGEKWKSAVVAILFAVHPLNVESVAWIAERKNLLFAFWGFLSLLFYTLFTAKQQWAWYILSLVSYILSLLSKPFLVTMPFLLLLLDYWPLGRMNISIRLFFSHFFGGRDVASKHGSGGRALPFSRLLLEKLPYFLLACLAIGLTLLSLNHAAGVTSSSTVAMSLRINNGLVSYVEYILKFFFPIGLSFFYPFPDTVPLWKAVLAILLLFLITLLLLRLLLAGHKFGLMSWFWFLGALVPVSGILQGGKWPAMADRFMYVPMIGLITIVVWGAPVIFSSTRHCKKIVLLITILAVFSCMLIARKQVQHWENSHILSRHALQVTGGSFIAWHMQAGALLELGRTAEAINAYIHASRFMSLDEAPDLYYNLGGALAKQGRWAEAAKMFQKNLAIEPDAADTENNLGIALERQGFFEEAMRHYFRAVQLDPDLTEAYYNIGIGFLRLGDTHRAEMYFREALRINPKHKAATQAMKSSSKVQTR